MVREVVLGGIFTTNLQGVQLVSDTNTPISHCYHKNIGIRACLYTQTDLYPYKLHKYGTTTCKQQYSMYNKTPELPIYYSPLLPLRPPRRVDRNRQDARVKPASYSAHYHRTSSYRERSNGRGISANTQILPDM